LAFDLLNPLFHAKQLISFILQDPQEKKSSRFGADPKWKITKTKQRFQ
jgi:hypothetical protein